MAATSAYLMYLMLNDAWLMLYKPQVLMQTPLFSYIQHHEDQLLAKRVGGEVQIGLQWLTQAHTPKNQVLFLAHKRATGWDAPFAAKISKVENTVQYDSAHDLAQMDYVVHYQDNDDEVITAKNCTYLLDTLSAAGNSVIGYGQFRPAFVQLYSLYAQQIGDTTSDATKRSLASDAFYDRILTRIRYTAVMKSGRKSESCEQQISRVSDSPIELRKRPEKPATHGQKNTAP